MRSSPEKKSARIIRNADVEGVVFCSTHPQIQSHVDEQAEEQGLKALEEFWHDKGMQEGRTEGYQQGFEDGEKKGLEKGYQEGYSQGLGEGKVQGKESGQKEGEEKARHEYDDVVVALGEAVEQLRKEKGELWDHVKFEMIDFVTVICERILCHELTDPSIVTTVIEELLKKIQPHSQNIPVDVLLSSAMYSTVEQHLGDISAKEKSVVHFHADSLLPAQTCVVKSSLGLVHFDIARQLESIKEFVASGTEE